MTEKIHDRTCPILDSELEISALGLPLGWIETRPVSSQPLSLEKILRGGASTTDPVYLDRIGFEACAYPVQLEDLSVRSSLSHRVVSPFYWKNPPYFGTPTALQVGPQNSLHSGLLYDPEQDRIFKQQVTGFNWYLVGDSQNYAHFLDGVHQFSDRLYQIWEKDSRSVFSWIPWSLEGERNFDTPTPQHALQEIGKFFAWLKERDPELHREFAEQVKYAEEYPPNDPSSCGVPAYAYYDPNRNRSFLLPPAIAMLEKGEYPQVAKILAHEKAHQKTDQYGLVPPSEEMMSHALNLFLERVSQDWPFGTIRVHLFGEKMFQRGMCQLLPLLPEEELQAFQEEIDYGQQDLLQTSEFDPYFASLHLLEILSSYFPSSWVGLSHQYIELAQARSQW